jgi:hypothetical protein
MILSSEQVKIRNEKAVAYFKVIPYLFVRRQETTKHFGLYSP